MYRPISKFWFFEVPLRTLFLYVMSGLSDEPAVQELFLEAAETFNPLESPEKRLYWLHKMAQLHAMRANHAEMACIHVKIFKTLHIVWSNFDDAKPEPEETGKATHQQRASIRRLGEDITEFALGYSYLLGII